MPDVENIYNMEGAAFIVGYKIMIKNMTKAIARRYALQDWQAFFICPHLQTGVNKFGEEVDMLGHIHLRVTPQFTMINTGGEVVWRPGQLLTGRQEYLHYGGWGSTYCQV